MMSRNAAPARERCSAPRGAALTSSLSLCHRSLPRTSLPAPRCRSQQPELSASSSQSDGGAAAASGCALSASALKLDGKPCRLRCCLSPSRVCMGVCLRVPGGGYFGKGQQCPLPTIAGRMWPSPAGSQEPSLLLSVLKKIHAPALTPSSGGCPIGTITPVCFASNTKALRPSLGPSVCPSVCCNSLQLSHTHQPLLHRHPAGQLLPVSQGCCCAKRISAWAVSGRAVTSVDVLGLNGLSFTRGSCYSCCRDEQGDA